MAALTPLMALRAPMGAKPNTMEQCGELKWVRNDPVNRVYEQLGRLTGPTVDLKRPFRVEGFETLEMDPNPSVHSIVVVCRWGTPIPDRKEMRYRERRGHVDATDWVRGEDQVVCGLTVPAVITDWILDMIDIQLQKHYGDRAPPRDNRYTIIVDDVSSRAITATHSAIYTLYEERDSLYD